MRENGNERSLDNVTKDELYYALLRMVCQHSAQTGGGYLWDMGIPANKYAEDLIDEVFGWDGTAAELNAEIERMKDILIDHGIRTY